MTASFQVGKILNGVYDNAVGWRPASRSIKPVHVANGLFRAVVGQQYDTTPVVELIAWERNGKPLEERTFERLIDRRPEVFRVYRQRPQEFGRMRRLARGVLAADGAVFPRADHSALTLASAQMISRDGSDRGVGRFAAALVGDPDDPLTLGSAVREALVVDRGRPRDPLTAGVWPLLPDTEKGRPPPRSESYLSALGAEHASAVVAELRSAASALASHERAQGNRLRTLQRTVSFACAGLFAHAQGISAGGALRDRFPFLLTLGEKGDAVSDASERGLDAFFRRFEEWLELQLTDRIRRGEPLDDSDDISQPVPTTYTEASERIAAIPPGRGRLSIGARDARLAALEHGFTASGSDLIAAFAKALMATYMAENVSGPRDFLRALGQRSGLFFPYFQGRSPDKRFRPSVPMIDMLVRSCVATDEILALEEFLERLWSHFGVIVGGRVTGDLTDQDLLKRCNLALEPSVLALNTERFVDQLVAIGLARRYADNVTFVGEVHGH